MLYYASRHIPSSLYPVEYEFRPMGILTGLVCEYEVFKPLPDREMAGGWVYAVCGRMDGLEGRE